MRPSRTCAAISSGSTASRTASNASAESRSSSRSTVGAIVGRIVRYFQARVPTLANTIVIESSIDSELPRVMGDPVLLEWAVEVLTKKRSNALAGGGARFASKRLASGGQRSDFGRRRRTGRSARAAARAFSTPLSTKKSGWGIGLFALRSGSSRRITAASSRCVDGAWSDVRDILH